MFKTIIIGVLCCAAGMVVQRHFDYTQLKEMFAELESDLEKTRGERIQRLDGNVRRRISALDAQDNSDN